MIIRHRGIYHTRFDAPFCGALISSISCDHGCPGCINDSLKYGDDGIVSQPLSDILEEVRSNPFNDGIILGGLEWTLQREEMLAIIQQALASDMNVILYTYHTETSLYCLIPELYTILPDGNHLYRGLYIKYGEYREDLVSDTHVSYTVPLASTNQYIVRLGYVE